MRPGNVLSRGCSFGLVVADQDLRKGGGQSLHRFCDGDAGTIDEAPGLLRVRNSLYCLSSFCIIKHLSNSMVLNCAF